MKDRNHQHTEDKTCPGGRCAHLHLTELQVLHLLAPQDRYWNWYMDMYQPPDEVLVLPHFPRHHTFPPQSDMYHICLNSRTAAPPGIDNITFPPSDCYVPCREICQAAIDALPTLQRDDPIDTQVQSIQKIRR